MMQVHRLADAEVCRRLWVKQQHEDTAAATAKSVTLIPLLLLQIGKG